MPYKINNTDLTLQPEEGAWESRKDYGIDGAGHKIYPRAREFQMRWSWMSASEFQQIQNFYLSAQTGTVTATLPQYGGSTYNFVTYSGCVLDEPQVGSFFEEYVSDTTLIIKSIVT
jgi:hypothetical protein